MSELQTEPKICERCESPLESGDLRCAICGMATPHEEESAGQRVVVQILRCTGCGAAITYDPKHQAPSCSFCGDVVKVESVTDPMEQTEAYLPFTVSEQQARKALLQWLGTRGWFRPSDLSTSARLTQLKPLWWVGWVFDADAFVTWTADSNAGSGRSSWAPHSGRNNIHFDDILVSASRGLSQHEVQAITPGMNLSTRRAQPEGAGDDATIEMFDVQRSQARRQVSAALQTMATQHVQNHFVPGTSFRNVRVSSIVRRLVTRRMSLPAYVLAYRYKERLYRVVICGQDQRLIVGNSPKSVFKMMGVAGFVLVIVLLFLLIMAASG